MTDEFDELERNRERVRVAVLAGVARARVGRQRLRIAAVVGAGLLLAAGVALGASRIVDVSPAVETGAAACYETQDMSDDPNYFHNGDGVAFDVTELCGQFWLYGQFGQNPPSEPNDFSTEYPVPPLAVCLGREGIPSGIPIFDGSSELETCTTLGLPVYED
jgi:hypothetical protein